MTTTKVSITLLIEKFNLRTALIIGLVLCFLDCIYILNNIDETNVIPSDRYPNIFPPKGGGVQQQQQNQAGIIDNKNPNNNNNISEEQRRQLLAMDKTQILSLLDDAGIDIEKIDLQTLAQLPKWSEVISLYGSEPRIIGLETCEEYQQNRGDPAEHLVGIAGTFNTGTNLMSELLIHNCYLPKRIVKHGIKSRGIRWQVPWGKHTPIDDEDFRQTHKTDTDIVDLSLDNIFPVIMIRDPAVWMASMCRHPYSMEWTYDDEHHRHCPNLVPNDVDIAIDPELQNKDNIPVSITYSDFTRTYDSIIHHWNEYYTQYLHQPNIKDENKKFPRVIVRYEDVIFHPMEVMKQVCTCAGGMLYDENQLKYVITSAKHGAAHGTHKTNYIDSIIKYGTNKHRYENMTTEDLNYLHTHISEELMTLFNYQYPLNGGNTSFQ